MLGRLASGAQHHLQRHQNSLVKMRELQKHMPLISEFVLFQFFLCILDKQDKMSHTCTTTCSILKESAVCPQSMYVCLFYLLLTINSNYRYFPKQN